jgi:hypothetical protein
MLVVAALLFPAALATPQPGPITIRLSPTPNQTIRTHMSQETTMTSEQESPAPEQGNAPQNIRMTMAMDTTATVGPANAQGHYESHVVCDSIETTATMNDKPMPIPGPAQAASALTFTIVYDDHGKTIDMTGEGDRENQAVSALKQMMTTAMTAPAALTLAVGESVTVPDLLQLPSTGGSSASGRMTTTGETKYTLTSITFDGADRIAHLTTKKTAMTKGSPGDTDAFAFTIEQRLTGDGTLDVNIDRGITLHSGQRINMEGVSRIASRGDGTDRSMRTHGTIAINSDYVK